MPAMADTAAPPGDVDVFMLDCYDSFTYNLVQYLEQLGARVTTRRSDQVTGAWGRHCHGGNVVATLLRRRQSSPTGPPLSRRSR